MPIYDDFMLVFAAMTFVVGLIKLMIALIELTKKK